MSVRGVSGSVSAQPQKASSPAGQKLYLITRRELPIGDQAVQAAHALRAFVEGCPEEDRDWYATSRTLVLLVTDTERDLMDLTEMALEQGIATAMHREPDHGGAIGAIALGPRAARLVRRLSLAFRG